MPDRETMSTDDLNCRLPSHFSPSSVHGQILAPRRDNGWKTRACAVRRDDLSGDQGSVRACRGRPVPAGCTEQQGPHRTESASTPGLRNN